MSPGLPQAGRIACSACHMMPPTFGSTVRTEGNWRITANPLAWGARDPEILVLGFSKGPTQLAALDRHRHNDIPYAGGRSAIGKIFSHLGLIETGSNDFYNEEIGRLIGNEDGRFHFGSLIRCTVEQEIAGKWSGTGGGMLDKFLVTPLGREVGRNCARLSFANLSERTRLIIMFGMGSKLNYVRSARSLIEATRPGRWSTINDVAYTDGKLVVVHTEHFKSQGRLLPDWLDGQSARGQLGLAAQDAVRLALTRSHNIT